MIPFCNIYSSFMQRAYDNVIHDVAIQDLPVVMCLDRGGLVGEDGVTHHGVFDMAAFGAVPGLTIAAPMNEPELRNMMYTAAIRGGTARACRGAARSSRRCPSDVAAACARAQTWRC